MGSVGGCHAVYWQLKGATKGKRDETIPLWLSFFFFFALINLFEFLTAHLSGISHFVWFNVLFWAYVVALGSEKKKTEVYCPHADFSFILLLSKSLALGLSRPLGMTCTMWPRLRLCLLMCAVLRLCIHVHTCRCLYLNMHACLFSCTSVDVCVCIPSSPPLVTKCVSCPQPLQWGCVLVLIPPHTNTRVTGYKG